MKKRKKKQDYKNLELTIIAIVLIAGIAAIYFMVQVNSGKAFYEPPQIEVKQTELQFCCCQTEAGRFYEVYGEVLKDADQGTKLLACKKICEIEHSTAENPSTLYNVGKCGETQPLY